MRILNRKKLLNLIFVTAIVGLIMFLALNSSSCQLFKKKAASGETTAESIKTAETKKEEKKEFGPTFDLGEIIVNLSDEGQARYAKMSVAFELKDEKMLKEVEKMDPLVRDIVVELLSGESSEKILSLSTRNDLKKRIMERVNENFTEGAVMQVFFTNVLVQ